MTVLDARPGTTQQELGSARAWTPARWWRCSTSSRRAAWPSAGADPADRRKRSIHLTDEGRSKLMQMRAVAREVGEQSFAALNDEERATLHHLLRKLAGFSDE